MFQGQRVVLEGAVRIRQRRVARVTRFGEKAEVGGDEPPGQGPVRCEARLGNLLPAGGIQPGEERERCKRSATNAKNAALRLSGISPAPGGRPP